MRARDFVSLAMCFSVAAVVTSAVANPATAPKAGAAPVHLVPITDFGAKGDGTTMNTAAIQKAIDTTAATGGTIEIPKGTFLSGAIFLKPGVNLHLDIDAVLKGSEKTTDYPTQKTRVEGHFQDWLPALVNADGCDHLVIDGEGTLDGSGPVYWAAFRNARGAKNLDVPRPRMCLIQKSKDVKISGLHFLNSGFWNLHLYACDGVVVDGLNIRASAAQGQAQPPSTDGIDVDSSRNVTINACSIYTNDDCIALKGSKGPFAMDDKDSPPVEHIHVTNCTFLKGGSFLTVGSEATVVRDVHVEHCKAEGPDTAGMSVMRLKLRPDSPELYEDIHFDDLTLSGNGALINVAPWTQYFDLMGQPQPTRAVRNISISNVKGTWGSFGSINGNAAAGATPADTIEKLTFENIDLTIAPAAGRGGPGPAPTPPVTATAATGPAQPPRPIPPNALPRLGAMVKEVTFKNVKLNGTEYKGPGN